MSSVMRMGTKRLSTEESTWRGQETKQNNIRIKKLNVLKKQHKEEVEKLQAPLAEHDEKLIKLLFERFMVF